VDYLTPWKPYLIRDTGQIHTPFFPIAKTLFFFFSASLKPRSRGFTFRARAARFFRLICGETMRPPAFLGNECSPSNSPRQPCFPAHPPLQQMLTPARRLTRFPIGSALSDGSPTVLVLDSFARRPQIITSRPLTSFFSAAALYNKFSASPRRRLGQPLTGGNACLLGTLHHSLRGPAHLLESHRASYDVFPLFFFYVLPHGSPDAIPHAATF